MLRCFVSFGRCTGSTDHIHDEAHVSGAREGFVSRPRTQCGRSLQLIEPMLCVMNAWPSVCTLLPKRANRLADVVSMPAFGPQRGSPFCFVSTTYFCQRNCYNHGTPMGWSRRCYHRVRTLWSVPFRDSVDSVPFSRALMSCLGCKDRLGAVPSEPVP